MARVSSPWRDEYARHRPGQNGEDADTALGIMAMMCPNRTADLDPCGSCRACKELRNARESLMGLFSIMADAAGSYFAVDW